MVKQDGRSPSGPGSQAWKGVAASASSPSVSIPNAGAPSLVALGISHYHDSEWEATYDASDLDAVDDWIWEQPHLPGAPYLVRTLIRGPDLYAVKVPVSFDDDGDIDETQLRFFATKQAAFNAVASGIEGEAGDPQGLHPEGESPVAKPDAQASAPTPQLHPGERP